MRLFYPGQLLVPFMFILTGALLVMSRFDIIQVAQVARYQNLWPVTLIAAGLEQLYLWARNDWARNDRARNDRARDDL